MMHTKHLGCDHTSGRVGAKGGRKVRKTRFAKIAARKRRVGMVRRAGVAGHKVGKNGLLPVWVFGTKVLGLNPSNQRRLRRELARTYKGCAVGRSAALVLGVQGPDLVAKAVATAPVEWAKAVWASGLLEGKAQRKRRGQTLQNA